MRPGSYSHTWHICNERICLYNGNTVPQSERCIKHGALMEWLGARFNGLTRDAVRAQLKRESESFTA